MSDPDYFDWNGMNDPEYFDVLKRVMKDNPKMTALEARLEIESMRNEASNEYRVQAERWKRIAEERNLYIRNLEQKAGRMIDKLAEKVVKLRAELKQRDRFINKHNRLLPRDVAVRAELNQRLMKIPSKAVDAQAQH